MYVYDRYIFYVTVLLQQYCTVLSKYLLISIYLWGPMGSQGPYLWGPMASGVPGSRDSWTWGSGSWDSGTRDLGSQDSGTRDLGSRDLGTRDLGSRDLGTWAREPRGGIVVTLVVSIPGRKSVFYRKTGTFYRKNDQGKISEIFVHVA